MSVYRATHASDEELCRGAEELVGGRRREDPAHGLMGVLVLRAGAVKSAPLNLDPRYCIYDTALEGRPSHSDVFQRVDQVPIESQQATRRALFAVVKNGFIKLNDFRNGLLLPWAATAAPM